MNEHDMSSRESSTAESSTRSGARPTDSSRPPVTKRLVLIGGGHAHAQVAKALNKKTRPSTMHVTLIDLQKSAVYSGMVPGCIAGRYRPEDTLIHLEPLSKWAGVEFINQRVVDVNLKENLVIVDSGRSIPFDVISIDIGSASRDLYTIKGAKDNTIATRPIAQLIRNLEDISTELSRKGPAAEPLQLVVVGAGFAGMELAMTVHGRWAPFVGKDMVKVTLLESGDKVLPFEKPSDRKAILKQLKKRNIEVRYHCTVKEVKPKSIVLENGDEIAMDHCLWSTGAGPHDLAYKLQDQGLAISDRGWIRVNQHLQSVSHPNVFAAGDCCTVEGLAQGSPPKAGVYAVRAGPVLLENVTRLLSTRYKTPPKLVKFKPQKDFMKLIVCGNGKAIGFRYGMHFRGKWVFKVKDAIDNGFMSLFRVENLAILGKDEKYDTSQYDDKSGETDRIQPMHPTEAAAILKRTDDEVDYRKACAA